MSHTTQMLNSSISEFMSKSYEELTRTERLKKRVLDTVPEIDSERMRLITEIYQQTEGEEMQIRRAKAHRYLAENMTLRILPDELVVGNNGRYIKAGVLFPENNVDWIEKDLELFEIRPQDPYRCTEETKAEVRKHIPYWKKHSKMNMFKSMVPEETWNVYQTGIICDASIDYGLGHTNVSYRKIINYGFQSVLDEIDAELAKVDIGRNVDDQEKYCFLRAARITVEGAINYCKRYAAYAQELAEKETDPVRKQELLDISERCEWVSEKPSRGFRDACQAFMFVHELLWIEQDGCSYTPGRFDQYMYPLYAKDLAEGKITREEAQELVECIYVKLCEINQMFESDVSRVWAGDPTGQDLMVGGVDENGKDATNEMSYICLDAMEHIRVIQPNLSVRYHPNTPEKLRLRAAEVIKTGIGMPQNFNDRTCIECLMEAGIPLRIARQFCIIGCVELVVSEDSWANGGAAWVAIPKIFELAMNQGKGRFSTNVGMQIGPKTQDPRTFKTYEEAYEAFLTQLKYFIYHGAIIMNLSDWIHGELTPQPFCSAMSLSPIKNGKDITRGGTIYNALSPQAVSIVNVADSLAALKKMVFDDKVFTMDEMMDMLDTNFEGKEAERRMLLNAPKYGNDDDYVDNILVELCRFWCDEVASYSIPRRGGQHSPGIYTVISNVPFGEQVGALPSGRAAGTPLADGGISPQISCDLNGPSAVINSAAKIDHSLASNGTLLNQRFHPAALAGDEGTRNLASLIKTYFDKGGFHIQFNVVSSETLRAAQENPDDYKDLLVRVAGYSAYFTGLSQPVQDNIIRRTEQGGH